MEKRNARFFGRAVLPNLDSEMIEYEYAIRDLIEKDSVTLLVGAPSCGKTALAMHMAKCMMTGQPFLGMPTSVLGRCAFLQFDMSHRQQIMYNKTFAPDCPIRFIIGHSADESEESINLLDKKTVSELCEWCKAEVIEVLFIDTLSTAFLGVDENSNTQMTSVMRILRSIAQSGITVIVLHHVSKGEFGYSQSTRGASALTGCTDTEIKLVETASGIEVRVTKTRSTTKGVKAKYSIVDSAIVEYATVQHESDVERIMSVFEASGVNELSRQQIVKEVKMGVQTLQKTLDEAVKMELLTKEKRGRCDVYVKVENSS